MRTIVMMVLCTAVAALGMGPARRCLAEEAGEAQAEAPQAEAPAAAADDEAGYSRSGLYLGLGGNYAFQQFDLSEDVSDSLGVGGRIGYRLHPVFATELAVDYYDDFDVKDVASISGVTVTAIAKLYSGLITGRVQPYASLGVGIGHFEGDDDVGAGLSDDATELVTRFGGGLDVYATENIVINVDAAYLGANGSLDGLDFIPILWGAQYRF